MKTESKKVQLDYNPDRLTYISWKDYFLGTPENTDHLRTSLKDIRSLVGYCDYLIQFNREQEQTFSWLCLVSFFIGLIPFMLLLIYLLVNH